MLGCDAAALAVSLHRLLTLRAQDDPALASAGRLVDASIQERDSWRGGMESLIRAVVDHDPRVLDGLGKMAALSGFPDRVARVLDALAAHVTFEERELGTGDEGELETVRLPQIDGEPYQAEWLVVATGRAPDVEALRLEAAGVALGADGLVAVDGHLRTSVPGVYAIVTGQDCTETRIGRFIRDRHALAREKVLYIGEPVAAVAAVDEETAERAVQLIEVEYEELPAVFTSEEALAPGAPILHPDLPDYQDAAKSVREGNVRNRMRHEVGDVDAAFQEPGVVTYEATYRTPRQNQGFTEPHAAIAQDGRALSWDQVVVEAAKGRERARAALSALPTLTDAAVEEFAGETFEHYEEHAAEIAAFAAKG